MRNFLQINKNKKPEEKEREWLLNWPLFFTQGWIMHYDEKEE
jgi:hypothetical protein